MSVSMIENWSNILGLVQAIQESHDLEGFDEVEVQVEQVDPVEGYPDLVATYLAEADAPCLWILMPVEVVTRYEISAGMFVECRVRRAGQNRIFVHSDYLVVRPPD